MDADVGPGGAAVRNRPRRTAAQAAHARWNAWDESHRSAAAVEGLDEPTSSSAASSRASDDGDMDEAPRRKSALVALAAEVDADDEGAGQAPRSRR
jgi:hypothetical protein